MNTLAEKSYRPGWFKFRVAEALGPGEHEVRVIFGSILIGPPVLVVVNGPDYDEQDRSSADIKAYHPDIDGIGWEDIWEAVRRQYPTRSPHRRATDGEYQRLKESIATFGSLQRVIVDETGNIIAGRLRKRACAELGVQCPTEVIAGLTPEQKEELSFQLDFCRKHLSVADKRRAAKFILKASPRNTDRRIGRACGLDHKTVGGIRDDLEGRGDIPQVEQRQGGDGKTYKFPKIVANTKKEEDRARFSLLELGQDAPTKPLDLRRVEGLVRIKRANGKREARNKTVPLPDDAIQIIHGDFRKLDIEDFSIPLILTDLPYDRAALPLWADLAEFAARNLRPGGLLVAYSGAIFLPEVYAALSAKLKYHWQHILLHAGRRQIVYDRNIGSRYKPILVFSQGPVGDLPMLQDVIQGVGAEKDFHEWQQNIEEAIHFIEAYTQAGDLVVDPFGGGFTTAAACYRLGRRCLSCDIDADAVQNGLERLTQEREQRENNK